MFVDFIFCSDKAMKAVTRNKIEPIKSVSGSGTYRQAYPFIFYVALKLCHIKLCHIPRHKTLSIKVQTQKTYRHKKTRLKRAFK